LVSLDSAERLALAAPGIETSGTALPAQSGAPVAQRRTNKRAKGGGVMASAVSAAGYFEG